jgi:hypothetical protein
MSNSTRQNFAGEMQELGTMFNCLGVSNKDPLGVRDTPFSPINVDDEFLMDADITLPNTPEASIFSKIEALFKNSDANRFELYQAFEALMDEYLKNRKEEEELQNPFDKVETSSIKSPIGDFESKTKEVIKNEVKKWLAKMYLSIPAHSLKNFGKNDLDMWMSTAMNAESESRGNTCLDNFIDMYSTTKTIRGLATYAVFVEAFYIYEIKKSVDSSLWKNMFKRQNISQKTHSNRELLWKYFGGAEDDNFRVPLFWAVLNGTSYMVKRRETIHEVLDNDENGSEIYLQKDFWKQSHETYVSWVLENSSSHEKNRIRALKRVSDTKKGSKKNE